MSKDSNCTDTNGGKQVPLILLKAVTKSFTNAGNESVALDRIELSIDNGSFTVIRGSSGAGKTTLLRILGLLDHEYDGAVFVAGRDVSQTTSVDRDFLRNELIGFVFQEGRFLNHLTVGENIALPLKFRGLGRTRREAELRDVGSFAFRKEELASGVLEKKPSEISGGQKQRATLARAIIASPKIVLADEPTASLDAESRVQVLEKLLALHRAGTTVVVVSHDPIFFDYGTQLELKDKSISNYSKPSGQHHNERTTSESTPLKKSRSILDRWRPNLRIFDLIAEAWISLIRRRLLTVLTFVSMVAGICQVALLISLLGGVDGIIEDAISDGSRLTRVEIRPRPSDLRENDRFPIQAEIHAIPEVQNLVFRRSASFSIVSVDGRELPFQTIGLHPDDPELQLFDFLAGDERSLAESDFGVVATPAFLSDVLGITAQDGEKVNWSALLGREFELVVPRFNRAGQKTGQLVVVLHVASVILSGESGREFYVSNTLLIAADAIKRDRSGSLDLPLAPDRGGWLPGADIEQLVNWAWQDIQHVYVRNIDAVVPVMTQLVGLGYRPAAEIWEYIWVLDLKATALKIFVPLIFLLGGVVSLVLVTNVFISAKLRESELALCRVLGMSRGDLLAVEVISIVFLSTSAVGFGLFSAQQLINALASGFAKQSETMALLAEGGTAVAVSALFTPVSDFGLVFFASTTALVLAAVLWPAIAVARINPAKVFSRH